MTTRRIDAHQHFWRLARGDYGWLTPALGPIYRDFAPEDLAPLIGTAGIDAAILVQAAPSEAETRFMLDIARDTDWVVGVVGWTDLAAPDAPAHIAELAHDPKLRGLRPMIHDIPDPRWMLGPGLSQAIEAIIAHGLTFDLLLRPIHLPHALALLERHPALRAVIDHGAKPNIRHWHRGDVDFRQWSLDMNRIARATAASCKLSGLVTEAAEDWTAAILRPYIDVLVQAFGPDRLIWGSDWPVVDLAGGYERWLDVAYSDLADLSGEDRAKVFGFNAARFYGV